MREKSRILHFSPDFAENCGQIVDNFFHLFVGHACREGKKCVFLWITASYPHISTKLSTTGENRGGKSAFLSCFSADLCVKYTFCPTAEKREIRYFCLKMWITQDFGRPKGKNGEKSEKVIHNSTARKEAGFAEKKEKKRIVFFTKRWYNNKKEKNLPRQSAAKGV